MGLGKNGTFDKTPDWSQWAILATFNEEMLSINQVNQLQNLLPTFIKMYWKFFRVQPIHIILQPIEGHGTWDGKKCFGNLTKQHHDEGIIAVLTRATIRLNKLKNFWANVNAIAHQMNNAPGFIVSYGIGEVPLIKQATFSIWENKMYMKAFAYNLKEHKEVIQKTRKENWYSEEMFTRFKVVQCYGIDALTKYLPKNS